MPIRALILTLALVPAFVLGATAVAEDLTIDEVREAIKAKPFPTKYKADMAVNVFAGGMDIVMTGTMAYDLPRMKMVSEMDMGAQTMNTTVAIDADGMQWIENRMGPGMTQIMKMDTSVLEDTMGALPGMPQMASGGMSFQPGPEMWDQMFESMDMTYDGMETVDGDETYVLSGKYRKEFLDQLGASQQMQDMGMDEMTMTMYVRTADAFPVRMNMTNDDGDFATEVLMTNIEIDPDFAEGDLEYSPPEGAPVMDLTEMMREQLGAESAPAQEN